MRPTLRLVALAASAGLQSSRGAERRRSLPPRLEEDVRLVGALAELFAAAAAERLIDANVVQDATRPTLPLIALATGAALCAPLLQQRATGRAAKGESRRRLAGARLPRAAHGASTSRPGAC